MTQHHTATDLAADLAQRCAQATLKGDSWQACCPAHDDRTPSLSITPSGDKVLIKCFVGCSSRQVMEKLGLTLADLFVSSPPANGHKRIRKIYPYHDAQGHIVHETLRYDTEIKNERFRQRRPDPARPGAYIWHDVFKTLEPLLYHLPAVLAAIAQGEPIHLTEGERDAETLTTFGLVATTVPMGAKYWRDSHTTTLTGAHVVLWPDNDEVGQERIATVQRKLTGKAKTLKVVPVPAPHKDVSDWIAAGGTKADVEALVLAHEPPPPPPTLAAAMVSYSELQALKLPQREVYLDWLLERSLVMVYGPRGIGKTMALLGLAMSLTTGKAFLKWPITRPTGVLYIDGEMSADELRDRARLLAGGQVPACLAFLPSELVYTHLDRDLTLTTSTARQEIDTILAARPALRVLILDNVSCLFAGIDENKKQDWEPINAWFLQLRHRGITVIVGHHSGNSGRQRGTSSREGTLNTVIALTYPPGYRQEEGCHFFWRFEKSRGIKGPTVEGLDVRFDEHAGWTHTTLEEVRAERLKLMLADGVPPRIIAEELGISASYVYRQKRYLGL